MRTFRLPAAFTLATVFAVGCGDFTSPIGEPGELGVRTSEAELPGRPDLKPGESNWSPPDALIASADASISSTGLATTDLNTLTPSALASTLVAGPGVMVSGVTYAGANIAGGEFVGGTGIIGIASGVILSSGNIASVPGPNVSDAITTNNGQPGDADLNGLIPGFFTLDRSVLEFDFQCGTGALIGTLQFNFVFTSDEYNEFVNSPFNDVFGFFLNGSNIALLPDGVTPVSINNVNGGNPLGTNASNPAFYINNDLSDGGGAINTEMDGLTVVLQAAGPLLAGTNHIKLAIADAGDRILDSNVFLEGGSFTCVIFVDIDIKPGSDPNSINCNNDREVIAVAVLTTLDFDAKTVDHTTVVFEGATETHVNNKTGLPRRHEQDVDGDGDIDLVFHFRYGDTGLNCSSTAGTLTGQTFDGLFIQGTDAVRMVEGGNP